MACSTSRRFAIGLVAVLALQTGATNPAAQEAEGRALAQQGKLAFDRKDFTTAIARYRAAYALYPAASLLFNLGQCHRRVGAFEEAIGYFKRYLQSGPPEFQADATREVIRATEDEALHARLQLSAARLSEAEEASRRRAEAEQARALAAQTEAAEAKARLDEALAHRDELQPTLLVQRWWFWTAIGVVVVGGAVATGVAVANAPRPTPTTFPDINAR